MSRLGFADLVPVYREQAASLIEGGVDVLIIETQQDILETKAAVFGARAAAAARGSPGRDHDHRLARRHRADAARNRRRGGARQSSSRCTSTSSDSTARPGRSTCANRSATSPSHTALPVACIPNAGLPINVEGRAHYPLEPVPMATELCELRQRVRCQHRRRVLRLDSRAHPRAGGARRRGVARARRRLTSNRAWRAACTPSICASSPRHCSSANASTPRDRARSSVFSSPTTTTASSASRERRSKAARTRSTCASRSPSAATRRSRCGPSSRRCR